MHSASTTCLIGWSGRTTTALDDTRVALFAGVATLIIAVVGAGATYIDNYYTTSVGQWVANDLRIRIYEHLHRLSLRFYDTAKTGTLM
jgi:subfamily B ATP-binding cassette protein MsbA